MLLFAFRDLWKEWGDSNFQIFSQNCQFYNMPLESLEHFNELLYVILMIPYDFYKVFFYIFVYTLHMCYVFNAIDGFF